MPISDGTTIMGITQPLFIYIQAAEVSVIESKNLLVATLILQGRTHQQIENRNIGPTGSQSEHTGHNPDQNKLRPVPSVSGESSSR